MRINAHERYGHGPCLATKQERLARFGFGIMFVCLTALIGGLLWS